MTRGPDRRHALGRQGESAPGGRSAAVLDLLVLIAVLTVVALGLRALTAVPTWAAILVGSFVAAGTTRLGPGVRILRALGRR